MDRPDRHDQLFRMHQRLAFTHEPAFEGSTVLAVLAIVILIAVLAL